MKSFDNLVFVGVATLASSGSCHEAVPRVDSSSWGSSSAGLCVFFSRYVERLG